MVYLCSAHSTAALFHGRPDSWYRRTVRSGQVHIRKSDSCSVHSARALPDDHPTLDPQSSQRSCPVPPGTAAHSTDSFGGPSLVAPAQAGPTRPGGTFRSCSSSFHSSIKSSADAPRFAFSRTFHHRRQPTFRPIQQITPAVERRPTELAKARTTSTSGPCRKRGIGYIKSRIIQGFHRLHSGQESIVDRKSTRLNSSH